MASIGVKQRVKKKDPPAVSSTPAGVSRIASFDRRR
jgi:hypothetical protein